MSIEVVAEIGINHNGDLQTAKDLVEVAKDAGCNRVKFQHYAVEDFLPRRVPNLELETWLRHCEMSLEFSEAIAEYCNVHQIPWFTSPTISRIMEAVRLGSSLLKCSSDMVTDHGFLEALAASGKPLILSTGMAYPYEVDYAVEKLRPNLKVILHCTSQYPTPYQEIHLARMTALEIRHGSAFAYGYSDHTARDNPVPALLAAAMGAVMIEKHITLDSSQEGPDHALSLPPRELKRYVAMIRSVEVMLGELTVEPTSLERASRAAILKDLP